ncbi:PEP-CTERM sorting domain-containing protein [Coraliomargarita sp. W4R53]
MKKIPTLLAFSVFTLTSACTAQHFTGGAGSDQNFSTAGNWAGGVVPDGSSVVTIAADGTSSSNPAIIDAEFGVVNFGTVKVYSDSNELGGGGMAYAAIASSGILRASNINVGNFNNQYFNGTLTIRRGGSVQTNATNGGNFTVGGGDSGELGALFIEDGATIQHTRVTLDTYGEMTFKFGANSVSTFNTVKNNAGGTNLLNGVLQVDLATLTSAGSYTLINSNSSNLLLSGQLLNDLSNAGGTITSSGQSSNFNVLNAGNAVWSLTTADGGQDLIFNVTSVPEPSTYAFLLGLGSIALVAAGRHRR